MKSNTSKYQVALKLLKLTENEVGILDQESTNGEGWEFYCSGYISKPVVFKNKIFGRVKDLFEDFEVEVEFDRHEIMSSCTCSRSGVICKHVIALLYSWVYDKDAFYDIGRSLELVVNMDRDRLLEIVVRILQDDPQKMDYFLQPTEDDIVTEDISDMF